MRYGARLGVDPGSVRVGVALSDPHGILASPLCTLRREQPQKMSGGAAADPTAAAPPTSSGGRKPRAKQAAKAHQVVPSESTPPTMSLRDAPTDLQDLVDLVAEHDIAEVVVGLAVSLNGSQGSSAQAGRAYAQLLANLIHPVPVRLVDERLTTVTAHAQLAESGKRGRGVRQIIDQVAATVVLQHALDVERSTGQAPGRVLSAQKGSSS